MSRWSMIATSPGPSRRVRRFVRRSSRAGPVNSTSSPSSASPGSRRRRACARARRGARRRRAARCACASGRPGPFRRGNGARRALAICGRCVIVITCARSARRASARPTALAVSPPMPASISSKTSVSPPATTAIASAILESSPPEAVCATGASGRPGSAGSGTATSSAPGRAGLALGELACELAVAEAEAGELGGDRLREARRRRPRAPAQLPGERVTRACASASACAAASAGSTPASSAASSAFASSRAREQLFVGLARGSGASVGDALEPGLDLLEPARLGAERGEERAQLGRGLAQPQLDVAQLVAGARELGRERLERRDRPLGRARPAPRRRRRPRARAPRRPPPCRPPSSST